VKPRPAVLKPTFIGVFRTLPESRMDIRVVDIVRVFPKPLHERRQRPYRQFFRIDGLRYLAHIARNLGIANEVVDELGIGRAECALDQRTDRALAGGRAFFGAFRNAPGGASKMCCEFSPQSTTRHCGRRLCRRTHSRSTIMHER